MEGEGGEVGVGIEVDGEDVGIINTALLTDSQVFQVSVNDHSTRHSALGACQAPLRRQVYATRDYAMLSPDSYSEDRHAW
jgi:hypothetical protein